MSARRCDSVAFSVKFAFCTGSVGVSDCDYMR